MVTTLTRLCPGTGLNVSVDSTVELDNLMEETRDMSGLSSLAGLEDCIPSSRNLYAKKRYSSVVKIQDWHIPRQAEPKDNDPYHPAGGNYFLSTYHRLGTSVLPTPNSETRDMLEQILCDKELGADDSDKFDDLKEGGIYPLPVDYGRTDYRTTMQYDYRPINPIPLKPVSLSLDK
ncbi:unnamed protein product [Timema podura]|uniref:Uncharacterized protein n=1 Tax=Timema podura TaxID=61482 RepID=A0ABN7PJX7_TIMPD|nr:unnamed protein product [Timema podura]